MATITSSMTIAQIEAVYLDNCTYAEDASVTKAKAFQSALRALILVSSTAMAKGGSSVSFDRAALPEQLKAVTQWISMHPATNFDRGGPNVTRCDFGAFR